MGFWVRAVLCFSDVAPVLTGVFAAADQFLLSSLKQSAMLDFDLPGAI